MFRLVYLVACVVLAGVAGLLYYGQTQQTTVLMASHDLAVGTRVADGDVAIRQVPTAAVPEGILSSADQALDQFIAFPVLAGQYLTARQLSRMRSGAAMTSGLPVPPGDRVLSLPVTPAAAVGGALAPGDLVDVIAIPDAAKGPPTAGLDPAGNTVLGQRVLVLGLRSDQGAALEPDTRNAFAGTARVGSVLLAIPESDEQRYAAAMGADTFVLTLVTG